MTSDQFNEKYKDFIEPHFTGLEFNIPEFTEWLDGKFEEFTKREGFKFSQIKSKFGTGRFYVGHNSPLSSEEIGEVEDKISQIK